MSVAYDRARAFRFLFRRPAAALQLRPRQVFGRQCVGVSSPLDAGGHALLAAGACLHVGSERARDDGRPADVA